MQAAGGAPQGHILRDSLETVTKSDMRCSRCPDAIGGSL
jgi:hypothetical protein